MEEKFNDGSSPEEIVRTLSLAKATSVAHRVVEGIVIGADTIVVLEGRILGKPLSKTEAVEMLTALSGKTHTVFTGFALVDAATGKSRTEFERTDVTFRRLAASEITEYVESGSPMDKAGAYGIQDDYGAVFVERIQGCFYTVVGFPLAKFYVALREFIADRA